MSLFFLFLGLVIGSFLNVVIYRLPRQKNIVRPRSFCPQCGKTIRFYHNIPVVSYLFLGGRCAYCGQTVPLQYPLVEVLTAAGFFLMYLRFHPHPLHLVFSLLFLCVLIVLAFIDLTHQILPDPLTLGGAAVFFLYSFFGPPFHPGPLEAFLAGALFALLFLGIYYFYLKVRRVEGLGLGDIKYILMLGIFLGIPKLVITILLASLSGLLVGIFLIIFKKKDLKFMLPFGTFLSLGGILSYLYSDGILNFIQNIFYGA